MSYSKKIREVIDERAVEQATGKTRREPILFPEPGWMQLKKELKTLCEAHADAVTLTEIGPNTWRIESKHNQQESTISFNEESYRISNFRSPLHAFGVSINPIKSIQQADGRAIFFAKSAHIWPANELAYRILFRIVSDSDYAIL